MRRVPSSSSSPHGRQALRLSAPPAGAGGRTSPSLRHCIVEAILLHGPAALEIVDGSRNAPPCQAPIRPALPMSSRAGYGLNRRIPVDLTTEPEEKAMGPPT